MKWTLRNEPAVPEDWRSQFRPPSMDGRNHPSIADRPTFLVVAKMDGSQGCIFKMTRHGSVDRPQGNGNQQTNEGVSHGIPRSG
jgi:hypothetical protein